MGMVCYNDYKIFSHNILKDGNADKEGKDLPERRIGSKRCRHSPNHPDRDLVRAVERKIYIIFLTMKIKNNFFCLYFKSRSEW
jgi:hypothetical protein